MFAVNVCLSSKSRNGFEWHVYILCMYVRIYVHISRYHGKRGISLWVICYIPQFELAVRHLEINHYCSLSLMSNHFSCPSYFTYLAAVDGIYSTFWVGCPDCDLKSALDHAARDVGNHSY